MLAVLDLDNFKIVNDRYGHAAGDKILIYAASRMQAMARKRDIVVRSGGEEYVVPDEVDVVEATAIVEGIRKAIGGEACLIEGLAITMTISAGVAVYEQHDHDFSALVRRADRALYRAKAAGRNRVEMAD